MTAIAEEAPPALGSQAITGPRFLTIDQVCEYLSLSKSTVYSLTDSGLLPSYPLGPNGGAIRIALSDLNVYLESVRRGRQAADPPPATARPLKLKTACPRRMGSRKKAVST